MHSQFYTFTAGPVPTSPNPEAHERICKRPGYKYDIAKIELLRQVTALEKGAVCRREGGKG